MEYTYARLNDSTAHAWLGTDHPDGALTTSDNPLRLNDGSLLVQVWPWGGGAAGAMQTPLSVRRS